MKRYGEIIRVKPEKKAEYIHLHANPWPEVNEILRQHGLYNFSIFEKDNYLFKYFQYDGDDLQEDLLQIGKYPIIQQWLVLCDACQEPIPSRKEGEWWASMNEIYHLK